MARSGLYKSEVKRARDALFAKGTNPSVDAVRIELGNTGSKTTIHKYLKELEEEDGGIGSRKVSISETLQGIVERLAAQLQDEANQRIHEIEASSTGKDRQHAEALAAVRKEVEGLRAQLQRAEHARDQDATVHGVTREALQQEAIARHTAVQEVADLKIRLSENEAHRQSLEEKHAHAREALGHYRQSVKEQRDQDQRRHEQQIQQLQAEMRQLQQSLVVKQDEVTRLNQEGARLVADISHTQKTLYDQQSFGRQLEQRLTILQPFEQRCALFALQAAEKDAHIEEQKGRMVESSNQVVEFRNQVHALQLELATTHAKLEAQQAITAELRGFIASHEKARNETPAG